jgi:hypothetical protein
LDFSNGTLQRPNGLRRDYPQQPPAAAFGEKEINKDIMSTDVSSFQGICLCVDLMSHATKAVTFHVHVKAQGAKAKTVNREY